MGRLARFLCVAALCVATADAEHGQWKGPGFYLLELFLSWGVDGGPYTTMAQCKARLDREAAPTEADDFRCEYFNKPADLERELGSA